MNHYLRQLRWGTIKNWSRELKNFFRLTKEIELRKNRWSSVQVVLILIVLSGFFSLLFIFKTNQLASKGYNLKELEIKAKSLRETNITLEAEVQKYRSRDLIQARVDGLEMISAKPIFVNGVSTGVALAK